MKKGALSGWASELQAAFSSHSLPSVGHKLYNYIDDFFW